MASTLSLTLHQTRSLHRVRNVHSASSKAHAVKPAPSLSFCDRRQLMLSLTVGTVLTTKDSPSMAVDIPLFGLRKKLEKVEEEAVEVVKEGIETAEKGIETVEKEVETAEREIETAVSFGGLAQAGAVAGAEVVGILVATSIVNSILGPEAQKSSPEPLTDCDLLRAIIHHDLTLKFSTRTTNFGMMVFATEDDEGEDIYTALTLAQRALACEGQEV